MYKRDLKKKDVIFESILQDTRDLFHRIASGQDDKCPSKNLSKNMFIFSIFRLKEQCLPLTKANLCNVESPSK